MTAMPLRSNIGHKCRAYSCSHFSFGMCFSLSRIPPTPRFYLFQSLSQECPFQMIEDRRAQRL